MAAKKEGPLRFFVDYRERHPVMIADRWLLPKIDEILGERKRSTVFTTIDQFQSY